MQPCLGRAKPSRIKRRRCTTSRKHRGSGTAHEPRFSFRASSASADPVPEQASARFGNRTPFRCAQPTRHFMASDGSVRRYLGPERDVGSRQPHRQILDIRKPGPRGIQGGISLWPMAGGSIPCRSRRCARGIRENVVRVSRSVPARHHGAERVKDKMQEMQRSAEGRHRRLLGCNATCGTWRGRRCDSTYKPREGSASHQ
jgi:hypothetical protein